MSRIKKARRGQRRFFPCLLIIAIASQCVYYFNTLNGVYSKSRWLVLMSITALSVGYFFGHFSSKRIKASLVREHESTLNFDARILKRISLILLIIGLTAHCIYYSFNPITSYGESYGASRGNGFITVFFIFVPISLILNEYIILKKDTSILFRILNRFLIVLYCGVYMLYLMKRRQVLLILLAIAAIWGPKLKTSTKALLYIAGIIIILIFTVFGRVRGYFSAYGLARGVEYALQNFDVGWLAIDELEGKYISRTLDDVYAYVQWYGCDASVLLGVLFIMVPRALLGGSKPLAFPEWYTFHFYPDDFIAGTGYAGSMIGELYLIGGAPLVCLGYVLIGFVTARMQERGSSAGDVKGNVIYAVYIYTLLLLPRYDLASLVIDIVFVYGTILWAVRRSLSVCPDRVDKKYFEARAVCKGRHNKAISE